MDKKPLLKLVQTRIDTELFEKIQQSGFSTYNFLREAIEEKLKNNSSREFEEMFSVFLREHHKNNKQLIADVEDRLIASVHTISRMMEDHMEHEKEIKDKMNEALRKILDMLKRQTSSAKVD